jgi:hypothetical protein
VPIAARMEQVAAPGEVYITAATRSLAALRIEAEALESVSVKGISEPIPVFALRRVRTAEEAQHDSARTPFVGRRAELIQFRGMLEACIEAGHGQTVYVRISPKGSERPHSTHCCRSALSLSSRSSTRRRTFAARAEAAADCRR